ncbi:MAG: endonuclease/exonuclease/phosphatase family protein [Kiritimatiellae bacterium]|nr:endonuclease/exonuclease/phosphatase family protein [Kiritimatiellia bacterium]
MRTRLNWLEVAALCTALLSPLFTANAQPWPRPPPPNKDEFSVMEYNLWRFSYEDRDRDGQKDNFKPEDQIAALITTITNANPDILAIEEIGDGDSFEILKTRLNAAGMGYTDFEYFVVTNATIGLGSCRASPSWRAIISRTNPTRLAQKKVPVSRGYLCVDIQVNPNYTFRLFVAHLKSKLYTPLGQTEMRRNEARLLNKHVRRAVNHNKDLNILVVGDMNDTITSAPLRDLIGVPKYLNDLRPTDFVGDVWTHDWAYQEQYSRINYVFANDAMLPEVVAEKCYIPREPLAKVASDHRPIFTVFKAYDRKSE